MGRVFVLMAGLTALFVVVGGSLAGRGGMLLALALAAGMNLYAWFTSDTAALRAFGARLVSPSEAPELYAMVDRLRQRAGLPMPRLAVAPQPQPNAFATGHSPDKAVVCVTQGLLQVLDQGEVEGVLAHELAHIRNGDMLLQTVAATLAGAVAMVSKVGMVSGGRNGQSRPNPLTLLLAPLAAMLIQFAISRTREFKADATGAEISGKPLQLAAALAKINSAAKRIPMNVTPTMAPLAQVDPLQAVGGGFGKLFATHPPVEERIERLREIAARGVEG
jgi:heat shock protein HtpX